MQCSCGGITSTHTHTVTTRKKIEEWLDFTLDGNEIIPAELKIVQDVCMGCGRAHVLFYSQGRLIAKRG